MKKTVKILLWIVGVLLLLIAGMLVAAKVLVTPERVRTTLIPLAESSLERKIEIGSIDVGLFSGVSLGQLRVYDARGKEVFVAAESGVLKYRFWPLLLGRVVVDRVQLVAPSLTVERFADGRLNLFGAGETVKTQPVPARQPAVEPGKPVTSSAIDLLVTEVSIERGSLLFIDHQLNPQAPYRYQLENLELHAKDVSLSRDFPLSFAARINDATLQAEGRVDPVQKSSKLQLRLDQLDLTAFAPYLRDRLPGLLSRAVLSAQLDLDGSPDRVAAQGRVSLDHLHMLLDALPDAPLRDAHLASEFDLTYDVTQGSLGIHSLQLAFNQIALKLQGQLLQLQQAPTADLQVEFGPLGVRDLLASVPAELVGSLAGLDPAGTVSGQLQLRGPVSQPLNLLQQGLLSVAGLQGNVGGLRPSVDGSFRFTPKQLVSEGLVLVIGDQRADLDLKIAPLLQGRPQIRCNLSSKQFNVDPLLQGTAAGAVQASGTPGQATQERASGSVAAGQPQLGPFDLPLDASGEIRIDRSRYQGLEISDLAVDYRLVKNILELNRISARLAGGTWSQTARIDLGKAGLAYQSDLKLEQVAAGELVKAFAPDFPGVVGGSINLNSELNGQGTDWTYLRDRLGAKGDLNMTQCSVSGVPLAVSLADFLQVEELRSMVFEQVRGTFQVVNGKLQLNAELDGKRATFKPQGDVGLDGSLSLGLPARLSPELAQRLDRRGQFSGLLADQDGWVTLPLRAGGSLSHPEVGLDASKLRKQVLDKASDKLQQKLLDKLAPAQAPDQPEDPKRKLLEDTLRGLLGK